MDKYTKLLKLNELKVKGVLTEAEFEFEKNKILSLTEHPENHGVPANIKPYTKRQLTNRDTNNFATIALTLGLIGVLIIPLLFGVIGLIFGFSGLIKAENHGGKEKAWAGLILACFNMIWGLYWFDLVM